ncbi:MAG: glutathione S-transferase family protein [Pseudomonadota bacterium]
MTLLYHTPLHAGSRMVRLVLAEYDVPFQLVDEALWQRREEFLAINPAATLPVLVDDEATIIGAGPIGEYCDETRGALAREERLFPDTPVARAEMRRMCDWALLKLENEVTRYLVTERVTKRQMPSDAGGGAPDSQALRAARANMRYHLAYLSWIAATRSWIAGERMSQADLAVAGALSVLDYLGEVDWENTDAAPLRDWYARMKSRPAFRPLLADHLRGIAPVSHYADLDF